MAQVGGGVAGWVVSCALRLRPRLVGDCAPSGQRGANSTLEGVNLLAMNRRYRSAASEIQSFQRALASWERAAWWARWGCALNWRGAGKGMGAGPAGRGWTGLAGTGVVEVEREGPSLRLRGAALTATGQGGGRWCRRARTELHAGREMFAMRVREEAMGDGCAQMYQVRIQCTTLLPVPTRQAAPKLVGNTEPLIEWG